MTNIEVLDKYCEIVLHSGCALAQEVHSWARCPAQKIYLRIARMHQDKLKSVGLVIGIWIDEKKYELIDRV